MGKVQASGDVTRKHSGEGWPTLVVPLHKCVDEIRKLRTQYRLPEAKIDLARIEGEAGGRTAVAELIKTIGSRHGLALVSIPQVFFPDAGKKVFFPQPVGDPSNEYYQFRTEWGQRALRKTIEETLQTLVQLPSRVPNPSISARDIRLLISNLKKCCDRVDELRDRLPDADPRLVHSGAFYGLEHLGRELKSGREGLEQALLQSSRMTILGARTQNPQLSVMLHLVRLAGFGTEKKQYRLLDALAHAAFGAAKKPSPKWVGRLALEVSRKKAGATKIARRLSP
jgi:hypothetical protein